ncbi:MAG: hypothetical protein ACUVQK_11745 [Thermogutta sp.]
MTTKVAAHHRRRARPGGVGPALALCLCLLAGCRSAFLGQAACPVSRPTPASTADITARRLERREQVRQDIQRQYADAKFAEAERPVSPGAGDPFSDQATVITTAAMPFADAARRELVHDLKPWEERLGEVIDDIAAGDDPAALVRLEDLLARHARDPVMVHTTAVQLLRVNRPDLVADKLAPIMRELPPDARLDQVLGLALYRLGRFSEAETVLLRSLELDNTLPLTYLFLGCTAEKLHKRQEARGYFKRASQLGL